MAVGAVNGSFAVSGTGGATYSVPIEAPVGVGGMQPSLAITYNSQSGNGVAGMGTSLSGISAITRVPKTIYHDTKAKGLTYLADDAFMLNGQRLIYSGTPGQEGQEGAEFYPESDPFTKVTLRGSYTPTSCDAWFEVVDKNGMKYYFGQTGTTSRQTYTSGSINRVNAWYLNYVEDPLGNFMDYEYDYNLTSYYPYLNKIVYGKNKNVTNSFVNTVEFDYEIRTDPVPFVLEGIKGVMNKRVKKITSKTGTSIFREYILDYINPDHFSRIQYITVKNGAGEELKPTQLNWNYLPAFTPLCYIPEVKDSTFSPSAQFVDQSFQSGDMNGDGITDLIGLFQNGSNYYAHIYNASIAPNGIPKFKTTKSYNLGTSYNNDFLDILVQKGGFSTLDMDGDGMNEFLVPTLQDLNSSWAVTFAVYSERVFVDADYYLIDGSEMPIYATGDFDNNGKGEFIWTEKGQINGQYPFKIVEYNISTYKLNSIAFNLTLPNKPEKIFADDYNSDGLTDVMVFMKSTTSNPNGYTIFWNQGNGISAQPFDDSKRIDGSTIEDNWMIRPGDFNGDGLTDFIMNESMDSEASANSSWYFAFGNGNGTFTKSLTPACTLNIFDQTFTKKDDPKFNCLVYDFDLDGKSDVVIHKAMYNKENYYGRFHETRTYWMRSTGTSLTKVSSATSNDESYGKSQYLVSGDFNGDGKIELMNYGHNVFNGLNTDQAWRLYRNPSINAGSGMLASVTSGYDLSTSITYAPLTNSSIYTKDTEGKYPVINIPLPMSAVQAVTYDNGVYDDNGVVGKVTEKYNYSGAKVHLQGKGFLGFKTVSTNNTTTGVTTKSGYNTLDLKWITPSETYSRTTSGGKTAETIVKYRLVDKDKKYFAYPKLKTELDLDSNKYTTTFAFDTIIGHITEEKTVFDGNVNMYKTTKYESYIKAGGRYQPQLVTFLSKHADDGQSFTQKTTFTYHSTKGYPLTKVENYGSFENGNTLALTTQYTLYDMFGNLKDYKVSGFGAPSITYKAEYDPTNRFVAKKYSDPASGTLTFLYDTWGNVTSETDETNSANLLTTTHSYNNWGQKASTTLSDGIKTTYHTGWDNKKENRKYFTLTQGKGQPWVKTWYDAAGRETASESVGPKGMKIVSAKSYNDKGQLNVSSDTRGNLPTVVYFDYDARGRIKFQYIEYGQRTDYTYGKRTVSSKSNGNTTTKTFDAWGGIKSVVDPLGNVIYTYSSVGKPRQINANGAISTMQYNEAGNQKMLRDPNAGIINYTYDAAGRVKTQVDNKGNSLVVNYDAQGRMSTFTLAGIQTKYTYGITGYDINLLTKVETGANSTSYTYDKYGRTATEKRLIEGAGQVDFVFGYNADGQLQTTTYTGGVKVEREYDSYGNPVKIISQGQTVWELTGAEGKKTTTRLGGTMTATTTLDAQGQLQNLATVKAGIPNIRDFGYSFNAITGNLNHRINGLTGLKETFAYDALDRLKSVKEGASEVETMAMDYHANGNVSSKTGLGAYVYEPVRVHAVSRVDYNPQMMPSTIQEITYNAFNKAACLKDTIDTNAYQLDISYGPDQQRWKSVLKKNGSDAKTIIFADDYEKFIDNEETKELYYIGAPDGLAAIYVKPQSGAASMYYAHTDHLGSIVSLTDSAGVAVFKASYDAWGRQTISLNAIGFYRGYTGHEHLPEFGLINMNGRMYDPVLGRFLSPDNYVQAADYSQSFNRYSYCWNNPLIYTDPSGDIIFTALALVIPGAQVLLPYAIAADIGWMTDYGMQVGMNYASGLKGSDAWFKKIDWFDVGVSAVTSGFTGGAAAELKAGEKLGKFLTWTAKNAKFITLAEIALTSGIDITGEGFQKVGFEDFSKRIAINGLTFGLNELVSNYTKKLGKNTDVESNFEDYLKSGSEIDRNNLTKSGRALQKHGSRPGSVFPQVAGKELNLKGQSTLNNILSSSSKKIIPNRYGGHDIFDLISGQGARFGSNRNFIGFLEP